MNYIALAMAPGIAICIFFFYKDVYNREPRLNLLFSFILGAVAILPAIWFEKNFENVIDGSLAGVAIYAYLVVGFSEEMSKFLALRLYSYRRQSFDEPLDGIVYSVMVSMGFATLENILYVTTYAEAGKGLQVGLTRMFISVPAHASFAVVMGYFVGKAKFNPASGAALMFMGVAGATFFHGTFDFFLFLPQYSFVGREMSEILLGAGALVSYIICLILSRKLVRSHRNISQLMFEKQNTTISA